MTLTAKMLTNEQQKIIDRCAGMLKRTCGGLKRIIFDLAPDKEPDTVHFEICGKIKIDVDKDEESCRVVDMSGRNYERNSSHTG